MMERVESDAMLVRLLANEFGMREDNRIGILRAAMRRSGARQQADVLEEELLLLRVRNEYLRQRIAEILDLDSVPRLDELADHITALARRREELVRQLEQIEQIVPTTSSDKSLVDAVRRIAVRPSKMNGEAHG